ncbi:hypothetical protein ASE40_13675 [Flavobacterium sp. Root935]|jgi:hypothetical protein|uniref:hypothetical protein n=1 Tax=unclassified Flavobacterium TaxID=196869 RepID=UPI00070EEF04|nr:MULTISPECIES: hypothetical protein [unclassified Flavobacterium]KRD59228.1 hypothetical protein ASE40_13675 [Flavobacterium sp. Root935]MDQ1167352.1 hypothetical protein [Flavobacterium sp. SORGH_AS_0622]TDX09436.1 hypothetical protein EDB96_3734 [Flavobacterium sp. S87F.05.LMB.W.Kidney.N]
MIYVFKTSVDSPSKFESASVLLHELLPNTLWNFDLEDCDNILRVDSELDIPNLILNNGIFECIELE